MAPSAGRDIRKPTKAPLRKLVQPVLPILPQKSKQQPQRSPVPPANSSHDEESAAATPVTEQSDARSRRGSVETSPVLQEGDKDNVEASVPSSEPDSSANDSKYGDEESSTADSSSNTQKAFSAPEPSSTPATEATSPPTDQLKDAEERISNVDLQDIHHTVLENGMIQLDHRNPTSKEFFIEVSPLSRRPRSFHSARPVTFAASLGIETLESTASTSDFASLNPNMPGLEVVSGEDSGPSASDAVSTLLAADTDLAPELVSVGKSVDHPEAHSVNNVTAASVFPSLTHYLQQSFMYRQDYDCALTISMNNIPRSIQSYPAHSFILSRSRVFRDLLFQARLVQRVDHVIHVNWITAIDVQGGALEALLRFLYTDHPLQLHEIGTVFLPTPYFDPTTDGGRARNNINMIVSYATTGLLLDLPPVMTGGLSLISDVISWDTLELTVQAAFRTKSLSIFVCSQNPSNDSRSSRMVDFSQELLKLTATFMTRRWIKDLSEFRLDISQQALMSSYLPQTPELASSLRNANAALSRLQFGSMPLLDVIRDDSQPSSSAQSCQAASAVLVNLPFPELVNFFDQIKSGVLATVGNQGNVDEVFAAIVQERERRRRIVLQSTQVSPLQRCDLREEWEVVALRESLENVAGSMRLMRSGTSEFGDVGFSK